MKIDVNNGKCGICVFRPRKLLLIFLTFNISNIHFYIGHKTYDIC